MNEPSTLIQSGDLCERAKSSLDFNTEIDQREMGIKLSHFDQGLGSIWGCLSLWDHIDGKPRHIAKLDLQPRRGIRALD